MLEKTEQMFGNRGVGIENNPDNYADSSLTFALIEGAEQMCHAQDKHLAKLMKTYADSPSSNLRTLNLLRLQYDLDEMQTSVTLVKNVSDKVSQTITSLTQRT